MFLIELNGGGMCLCLPRKAIEMVKYSQNMHGKQNVRGMSKGE